MRVGMSGTLPKISTVPGCLTHVSGDDRDYGEPLAVVSDLTRPGGDARREGAKGGLWMIFTRVSGDGLPLPPL